MKNLFVLLALVFIASCSSAPQKTKVPTPPIVESEELEVGSKLADEGLEQSEEPAKEPEKVEQDQYKKLAQALMSKSLKQTQRHAFSILARDPKDIKALNALAVAAIGESKYDLARMFIAKVLEQDSNNSSAFNNLGVVELKSDNLRGALVNFKKAISLNSDSAAAHANLGAIYLKYRNYQSALSSLKEAVDNGDQSPETYSNLGFAYKGLGRFSNAEGAYENALAKDPNNTVILLNYAALLAEHAKQFDKASKLINKLRFTSKDPAIIEKANQLSKSLGRVNGKTP
ncbi:MAG: tetratricopeptide repeat protein [Oligoflexia bacterium]|nr:tetratricopeptide repeat protein [Oligoflexia bacterium]